MSVYWRILLVLALLCRSVPVLADVKIFITNDVHGYAADDPAEGRMGYARLKALAGKERGAGHSVFLLDAGDAFSGSAAALVDRGRAIAAIMGQVGYRALTPGNHAFDHNAAENNPLYYSEVLLKTLRENSAGPVDVVAQNLSRNGAPLPGVGAEPVIIYDATGQDPDGLRVVVAGLVTPYTAGSRLKDALPGYDFGLLKDAAATRESLLQGLADALAGYTRPHDVVIVLSHLGYAGPDGDPRGRITGPDLAAVPNVDFVADGHTHEAVEPRPVGTAVYANGGRYLEHIMAITLTDGGAGRMELLRYADLAALQPDAAITENLAGMDARQGWSEILFASPDAALFSERGKNRENIPLGRLICEGMLRATGADLALQAPGTVRAGLPAGPVSVRDLINVLPFEDKLAVAELTGKEITAIFDRGAGHGGRGFPQFYGFTAYAWRNADGGLRLAGLRDGKNAPLDPDKTYRVALNGFMAQRMRLSPWEDHGDLVHILRRQLARGVDAEGLRAARPLLLFPDAAGARAAWEKAEGR